MRCCCSYSECSLLSSQQATTCSLSKDCHRTDGGSHNFPHGGAISIWLHRAVHKMAVTQHVRNYCTHAMFSSIDQIIICGRPGRQHRLTHDMMGRLLWSCGGVAGINVSMQHVACFGDSGACCEAKSAFSPER